MADVCFQYDNGLGSGLGAVVREKFEFGELPIMLMVRALFLLLLDDMILLLWRQEFASLALCFDL